MKVIAEPTAEPAILSSVIPDADVETVARSIIEKSEHCVVHLCGCDPKTQAGCR